MYVDKSSTCILMQYEKAQPLVITAKVFLSYNSTLLFCHTRLSVKRGLACPSFRPVISQLLKRKWLKCFLHFLQQSRIRQVSLLIGIYKQVISYSSRFRFNTQNKSLAWIFITTLHDSLKKLTLLNHPIRSETEHITRTHLHMFSRASRQLRLSTSRFDWFVYRVRTRLESP